MTEPHRPRVKYVIGPDGSPLTIADLPPANTKRWVIRRKAAGDTPLAPPAPQEEQLEESAAPAGRGAPKSLLPGTTP